MNDPICEQCGQRPAVVFITKMLDEHTTKHRFCEICAREKAVSEGWLSQLVEQWGDEAELSDEMREALGQVPLEEIMMELFESDFPSPDFPSQEFPSHSDGFEPESFDGHDAFDLDDDFENSDAFAEEAPKFGDGFLNSRAEPSHRCPNCNTTWDRIKEDGRAGCAACYETFRDQLLDVMHRVQRGESHVGKAPRAAEKRRRRLDHLRQRRDHQLEMLHNRLKEAVSAEKYEEAARLRDKIKIVSSTVVSE